MRRAEICIRAMRGSTKACRNTASIGHSLVAVGLTPFLDAAEMRMQFAAARGPTVAAPPVEEAVRLGPTGPYEASVLSLLHAGAPQWQAALGEKA